MEGHAPLVPPAPMSMVESISQFCFNEDKHTLLRSNPAFVSIIGLQRKVSLGFIWENPRVEQHDATEVVVDGSRDELRLTCILTPPLPLTKENYVSRDSIVKWMKVRKTHGNQVRNTFWSDGQDITAISLSKLKLHDLGTYGCSYQSLLKTINITGIDNYPM